MTEPEASDSQAFTSIALAWAPADHAAQYVIERAFEPPSWDPLDTATGALAWEPLATVIETGYTDSAAPRGTVIHYRVIGQNGVGATVGPASTIRTKGNENTPQQPASKGGGRPKGIPNVPPLPAHSSVMHHPVDGATNLALEAIMAGSRGLLAKDRYGRPAYERKGDAINGTVIYLTPGQERENAATLAAPTLDAMCTDLWAQASKLGAADLQLLLCVSNQWLNLTEPTKGILINYRRYAEARGLNMDGVDRRAETERIAFSESVRRLASLHIKAEVARFRRRRKQEIHMVGGSILLAESVTMTQAVKLHDEPTMAIETVNAWRLIPGLAWIGARELGQIGRFPEALLQLDPYHDELLIRLGVCLGRQEAIRMVNGTVAQSLSVRAMLEGIQEPIPDEKDKQGRYRVKRKLERALERLQDLGILTSWQWLIEGTRGTGFLDDSIHFIYHWDSVQELAEHHPNGKKALGTEAVQALLPFGRTPKQHKKRLL